MKRILVVVMVLSFAISIASAGLISFGFGAHALNSNPFVDNTFVPGTVEDWDFGAEMRLRVLFLEAQVNGQYTPSDQVKGLVTVGTSMSLFDLVHLGVSVGPSFGLEITDGGEIGWLKMGDGPAENTKDLGEVLKGGLLHYRAHGDVKLGRISFGFTYQVPSKGYTMENDDVLKIGPDWDQALVGTTLLFWLF